MTDLIVDNEFKNLIPLLDEKERLQLEENILRDGIQDPLKTWNGIIVDGHNRYTLAQKHGLTFETIEMDFADRSEAKIWILKNQLGRRNLIAPVRIKLALLVETEIAQKAKERQLSTLKQNTETVEDKCPQRLEEPAKNKCSELPVEQLTSTEKNKIDRQNKTNYQLAQMAGVSDKTVQRYKKILQDAPAEIVSQVDTGKISINEGYKQAKLLEKAQEIEQAKETIAAQSVDDYTKPKLFIGNGINFTPDEPYKLLLTDPPYSTDVDDIQAFAQSWLPNALTHVRNDGFAYVFIGAYPDELRAYLNITPPNHLTLIQILVWTYRNTLGNNPKNRYKQNWQACLFYRGVDAPPLDCPLTNEQWAVQDINAPDGRLGNRFHTWQKPDEIAERFIRHSTKKGDTVFDPFACTGTFLLAAAKLGRNAYGFEINPDNAQIAFERGCINGRLL